MKDKLLTIFKDAFGDSAGARVFFAPGRVNLIGDHTDYNGGHVFPGALTIGTYAACRKREDSLLRLYSENFKDEGIIETPLADTVPEKKLGWVDYVRGVIWEFKNQGMELPCGLDIAIWGNIPAGSGLSSSASLEVLTGFFLREIFGFKPTNTEIALIGQKAENNFCGMNCGIMDQFASAMGKKDHAILLDTATLSYEYAPLALKGISIVVTNSNVKHSLVTSAYNERRQQSESALKKLQTVCDIKTLGDLTMEEFGKAQHVLTDDVEFRRARHAVSENQRVITAAKMLKEQDVEGFGRLMNESHVSLRDDYETSCPEMDALVSEAWKLPGVLGSRITGGGFGGCSVSLVKDDALQNFQEKLAAVYKEKTGLTPDFYIVSLGDGPAEI
ncbi:MAG: galactokinase [Lachnospiraceae bacterium]|nr:galactokinase [Lachnospiraceae bacterium]